MKSNDQNLYNIVTKWQGLEIDLSSVLHFTSLMVQGMSDASYKNKRNYLRRQGDTNKFLELGMARDLYKTTVSKQPEGEK